MIINLMAILLVQGQKVSAYVLIFKEYFAG